LETVFKALKPETAKPATTRCVAKLARERNALVLSVEAKDTVALRAMLNAYLRWMGSVISVFQALEE